MAIEKRTIGDIVVGFNTETNSYCNLPKDLAPAQETDAPPEIADMTVEQLKAYAAEKGIDITAAKLKQEIVDLITAAAKNE